MEERAEREVDAARLEAEMAEVCGVLNAATGRLVGLIGEVLGTGCWQGSGIRSAEQWVAWKCGVSPRRARTLVLMARRLGELPETRSVLELGALSEDQVALVCRHAPTAIDAEVAVVAQSMTVTQLRRVLGTYVFEEPAEAADSGEPSAQSPAAEARRVSFGHTEDGSWRLSAVLAADEGAQWEQALTARRDELSAAGDEEANQVTWADAFVAVAQKCLAATAEIRPHRDRHLVLLHLNRDEAHLHLGPGLGEGLRRYLSCDSRVRAIFEEAGRAVSVGRAFRIVPDRTRIVIEDRDRGCRVPGCDRSRWLHVHHVRHWEDGGTTDTANLLALCQHHHRLHHRGGLGIEGNADEADGIVFTDGHGRRLDNCGRPTLPGGNAPPAGRWVPPSGEPLDPWAIYFNEPDVRRAG